MLRRLERVLDLRPGELGRGLLLFAYLFFVIGSFTVGKAVRDALFIDEFGAMLLPYADMAIAAIVGIWVSIYLRIARRANVRSLLMGSLGFFALNCLAFWYLTHISDAPWLTPVLYVWVGMFGVVAPAQVWTLANYVLTTREAKRMFGFIGSGATAGWIIGGFITRYTATRFGAESSLLGMAVCLVIAGVLVDRLWVLRPLSGDGQRRRGGRQLGPAAQPDVDCRLAVPARDCRRDSPVVLGHGRHRLAVQGRRRAIDVRPRRARGVFRAVQLLRRIGCRLPCSGC